MKKTIILLMILIMSMGLSAQSSDTLDELRFFVQSALLKAEQLAPGVSADTVIMGEILLDYQETGLGQLLQDLFIAEITNRSPLSLANGYIGNETETSLMLEGNLHIIDNAVYMQLVLTPGYGMPPLAVVEKTMDYNMLSSLLVQNYDDTYYDTPVVRDDFFLEPNNYVEESRPIVIGESVELALTQGDSDWFYFEITEDMLSDDAYMVEVYTSGDMDTYMEVYGPNTPDVFYGESDDYYDSNAGMSVTVNEAGTYWIHVYGYSEDISGYYYLESFGDAVEYADQFEPNNTWEQSTDIDWNLEQEHAFAMGDNKDVFVFELDRTTEVVFYTQSDMDTYMDIYDENGEYITGDDDGGKDSNARIETDLDRGLYYLEVMPYEENVSGNYSLSAKKE